MTGLEPRRRAWHGRLMPRKSPLAGGFFLILAIFAGLAIGVWRGEPTLGVIAGTALGAAIALIVWWRDRRRVR